MVAEVILRGSRTVEFDFSLRQVVKIKAIKETGHVVQLVLCNDGLSYKVAYWLNGKREEAWCFAEELEEGP